MEPNHVYMNIVMPNFVLFLNKIKIYSEKTKSKMHLIDIPLLSIGVINNLHLHATDSSALFSSTKMSYVSRVVGALLYYAMEANYTIFTSLNDISAKQLHSTMNTLTRIN